MIQYSNIKAYNQIWSPMGRYPMVDNTIFETYSEALGFATTSSTAVVGNILTVINDIDENKNGVYVLTWTPASTEDVLTNSSQPTGLKKIGSDIDLSNYVTKDELTSIYTYKGSVDNYEALVAVENPAVGDVYNVVASYTNGNNTIAGGTNWVWNGSAWDALAGSIDLSGYALKSDVESSINTVNGEITTINGTVQALSSVVDTKVSALEGHSLISDENLAKIGANESKLNAYDALNISSRLSDLESYFKDGEVDIDLGDINATLGQHTTLIGNLENNKADKTVIESLQLIVNANGAQLSEAIALNATQTQQISDLSAEVSGFSAQIDPLQSSLTTLTTTVEDHTTSISTLNSGLEAANAAISNINNAGYITASDIEGKADTEAVNAAVASLNQAINSNLTAAKSYADGLKIEIDTAYAAADIAVLQAAKAYADETAANVDFDDSALIARISASESAISNLKAAADVEGSVLHTVDSAINAFAGKMTDNGTIDTFKELVDYAASHDSEYTTLAGVVQANSSALVTLKANDTTEGSIAKIVKDAVASEATLREAGDASNLLLIIAISNDYLKNADKEALIALVEAEANRAKDIEGGLETRLSVVESDYLISADKTTLEVAIASKVSQADYDTKIAELVQSDEDNLVAAKAYVDAIFSWTDINN